MQSSLGSRRQWSIVIVVIVEEPHAQLFCTYVLDISQEGNALSHVRIKTYVRRRTLAIVYHTSALKCTYIGVHYNLRTARDLFRNRWFVPQEIPGEKYEMSKTLVWAGALV